MYKRADKLLSRFGLWTLIVVSLGVEHGLRGLPNRVIPVTSTPSTSTFLLPITPHHYEAAFVFTFNWSPFHDRGHIAWTEDSNSANTGLLQPPELRTTHLSDYKYHINFVRPVVGDVSGTYKCRRAYYATIDVAYNVSPTTSIFSI